jgi:Mrp family chromosome partitioning ATPase
MTTDSSNGPKLSLINTGPVYPCVLKQTSEGTYLQAVDLKNSNLSDLIANSMAEVKASEQLMLRERTFAQRVSDQGQDASTKDWASQGSPRDPSVDGGQTIDLLRILQLMQGRMWLAVVAMLILGGIGGAVGFKLGQQTFSSVGMIRVMASVPKILFSVDEKDVLPMFDSFVDSQVALINSQRTIDLAMQDPAWQALGRGTSDRAAESFSQHVAISHAGEIIRIEATDPDPKAAMTEVSTLIGAYRKIYEDQDAQSDERRIELLQSRKTTLSADLANKRQQILDIAKAYGSDDLGKLYDFKQEQVNRLDEAIADKQMLLSSTARSPASSTTRPAIAPLSVDELAASDPTLANLLSEESTYKRELLGFKAQNLLRNHPQVAEARALLDDTEGNVQARVDQLQKERSAGVFIEPGKAQTEDEARVQEEIASLQDLRSNVHSDLVTLGQQKLQIDELKTEAQEVQNDRDETQRRIDQLTLESSISGRIVEISDGDRPFAPVKDTRKTYCAALGMGGGMLGFGMVFAMALLDRRLRSPGHAQGGKVSSPMLGLLPQLPEDLSDHDQMLTAARCVGEIRALLQISGRTTGHRVLAITSPDAGAGKTSLTLALGASYASSCLRTVVVDCDLVAGGLTRRAKAVSRLKLGQVLQQQGIVTAKQVLQAVARCGPEARRLGEILLEEGLVTEESLARALELQQSETMGILDALRGEPLENCVSTTEIEGLHILPVGNATARDVSRLYPDALHRLTDRLQAEFDVVLIDTGPILGSVEASLLAGIVDGVVMVVCKGGSRPLLERAHSQLLTLGARIAGVIFNGADRRDVATHARSSSIRSVAPESVSDTADLINDLSRAPSHFGPLTSAVVSFAPFSDRKSRIGDN